MFFGVQDGERMVAKGEDHGGGGGMGASSPKDDALVAEMEAVKKAQGKVADRFSCGGRSQRVSQIHERRIREISGSEIRWRAR